MTNTHINKQEDNELTSFDTMNRYEKISCEYEYKFIKIISCISDGSKWFDLTGIDIGSNKDIRFSDKSFNRILDVAKYAIPNFGNYVLDEEKDDDRFHNKIFVTKNIKGHKDKYTIDILELYDVYQYVCYSCDYDTYYDMSKYNLNQYNDSNYPWGIGNY